MVLGALRGVSPDVLRRSFLIGSAGLRIGLVVSLLCSSRHDPFHLVRALLAILRRRDVFVPAEHPIEVALV
jgi:hypothetical protein